VVARLIRAEFGFPVLLAFTPNGCHPMCGLGWQSLGVLKLTARPSINKDYWVPLLQETDTLLVEGGDPLYLCYWMRQSGLADLLPKLPREAVYVGLSAGSMMMAPASGRTSSAGSRPPVAIARWDWWILRCFRTWITLLCRTIPWPTRKNGPPACRCRRT
jgi:dipeptidase E